MCSYPSWDALKIEDREEAPTLILTIKNAAGQVVRRLTGPATAGPASGELGPSVARLPADHRRGRRLAAMKTTRIRPRAGTGRSHCPGSYTVSLEKREDQATTELVPPAPFVVEPLNFATLAPGDRQSILAFAKQTGELQRAALGTLEALNEGLTQVTNIKRIIERTPSLSLEPPPRRPRGSS